MKFSPSPNLQSSGRMSLQAALWGLSLVQTGLSCKAKEKGRNKRSKGSCPYTLRLLPFALSRRLTWKGISQFKGRVSLQLAMKGSPWKYCSGEWVTGWRQPMHSPAAAIVQPFCWIGLEASSVKSWSFLLLCYLLVPLSCFVLQSCVASSPGSAQGHDLWHEVNVVVK